MTTHAPAPPGTRIEFPYLDGIRGLAAIVVVLYHAWLFTGLTGQATSSPQLAVPRLIVGHGYLGVPVFIVLSGYVLMLPIARAGAGWYTKGFGTYIFRRAKRILPPYYAALLLSIALIAAIPLLRNPSGTQWDSKVPLTAGGVVSHLLMLQDVGRGWIEQLNGPMWSVAVEFQIYFLMPLILLLWRFVGGWAAAAITAAVSVVPVFFGILTFAHTWLLGLFAVGMLAARLTFAAPPRRRWIEPAALAAGLAVAGVLYRELAPVRAHGWMVELVAGCLTAAVLVWLGRRAVAGRGNLITGFFGSRPMLFLGLTSYSIYLFHSPLIALANLLLLPLHLPLAAEYLVLTFGAVPLALGASWLMFYLVERHFLNSRQRTARGELREGREGRHASAPAPDGARVNAAFHSSQPLSAGYESCYGVANRSQGDTVSDHTLRVAIISLNYAPERTGIARYTSSLAQGLHKRGHDVQVITTHPHYPEWKIHEGYGQWRRDELVDGVPVRRLRHYVPRRPTWIPRALGELSFGLRALLTPWGGADVVVLPSPALFACSLILLRARLLRRRPATVMWVQDLYSLGAAETQGGGGSLVAALSRVESATLRTADGVALIHSRFRDEVVSHLGVEPERVGVIRNWTSVAAVDRAIDRHAVRLRMGWTPEELVLMHTGNMGVKQGLENVIEMARLADAIRYPVRVVFTGGGSQKDRLVELAAALSNVEFLDALPDGEFEEVLNCADVLLLNEKPGVAEMAVPSKLTTYFSTGLPVVAATDAASISAAELDVSGGGLRVDPGDPAALLQVVTRLGTDSALRARLGMAGREFRDRYLAEDTAIDNYVEWLQALVEQHSHARV